VIFTKTTPHHFMEDPTLPSPALAIRSRPHSLLSVLSPFSTPPPPLRPDLDTTAATATRSRHSRPDDTRYAWLQDPDVPAFQLQRKFGMCCLLPSYGQPYSQICPIRLEAKVGELSQIQATTEWGRDHNWWTLAMCRPATSTVAAHEGGITRQAGEGHETRQPGSRGGLLYESHSTWSMKCCKVDLLCSSWKCNQS